jgi:DNA-binding NarL/FixJ family response regulator
MPIRIVLVDDDPNIHDVIQRLMAGVEDMTLAGQAYDGAPGIEVCWALKPDLVLMDVMLPGMNGAAATAAILDELPQTRILTLSSFHEYEYIRAMLESGAAGYVVKGGMIQDLVATIRSTMQGNTVLSPQAMQAVFAPPAPQDTAPTARNFALTEREMQVLRLLAQGWTYAGVAQELRISQPTVRFHMTNILEKMGVQARSEALILAARNNLL